MTLKKEGKKGGKMQKRTKLMDKILTNNIHIHG